jgi:hypothetical protein
VWISILIYTPQILLFIDLDKYLLTASGRICCLRCTAKSTRTKLQCGRPALKASKTQKCQFHGGRSTGPKTEQGRSRIAQANLKHGQDTRASIHKSSQVKAKLRQLEDIMYLYGMTTAPKTRGRKPLGYIPVRTKEQARQLMQLTPLGG